MFFLSHTSSTMIYTLSLHDALPISFQASGLVGRDATRSYFVRVPVGASALKVDIDRKSTRLNSSHGYISHAVFCLKKKKMRIVETRRPEPPRHQAVPRQEYTTQVSN